jgi:rhodanese-related sulfurtransferase
MSNQRFFVRALLPLLALFINSAMAKAENFTLPSVHEKIKADYNAVHHLTRKQLESLQSKAPDELLLFDVRERAEYDVSHISGAHRLDPGLWKSSFMKNWGQKLKGKTIVFYCSVGVRSSKMAAYLKEDLINAGASSVYNLKDGVFGWSNEQKPLVNENGSTEKVHPFNDHWGQLLKRKEVWQKLP